MLRSHIMNKESETTASSRNPLPLVEVEHLSRPWSWTMGLAGLVKWLSWQTSNILGMSKTQLVNYAIKETLEFCNDSCTDRKEAVTAVRRKLKDYKNWITPPWVQYNLRIHAEDYLNKEFDILFSLLPDKSLDNYFSSFFQCMPAGSWQVFGNSNDFEYSTGVRFMQMDTLAFSESTGILVALELKVDAPVGDDQVLKYCYMVAFLEKRGLLPAGTVFKFLIISASEVDSVAELRKAVDKFESCPLPRRGTSEEEMLELKPRVRELLSQMELNATTWQDLGCHFSETLETVPRGDGIYHKLVGGFLESLALKKSKSGRLFHPR